MDSVKQIPPKQSLPGKNHVGYAIIDEFLTKGFWNSGSRRLQIMRILYME
ncbi:hypothetical protein P3G55_10105 [Leptospira sp. 96542]|nr:hypothetical protein [Leptospira sp. 96542]